MCVFVLALMPFLLSIDLCSPSHCISISYPSWNFEIFSWGGKFIKLGAELFYKTLSLGGVNNWKFVVVFSRV